MWDKTMDNAVLYFAPPPGDRDNTTIMITALSEASADTADTADTHPLNINNNYSSDHRGLRGDNQHWRI